MAKQVLQRLSFTAGELTPWLAGRADLDPVSRGASRLINFLVSPFGGLRRRPGTRLVARAGCRDGMVRLVSLSTPRACSSCWKWGAAMSGILKMARF